MRIRSAIAGAIAVMAAMVLNVAPAAATPLTAGHSCETGQSRYLCMMFVQGGVEPFSFTHSNFRVLWITADYGHYFAGGCSADPPPYYFSEVDVTVTDAVGNSVVEHVSFRCNRGEWT